MSSPLLSLICPTCHKNLTILFDAFQIVYCLASFFYTKTMGSSIFWPSIYSLFDSSKDHFCPSWRILLPELPQVNFPSLWLVELIELRLKRLYIIQMNDNFVRDSKSFKMVILDSAEFFTSVLRWRKSRTGSCQKRGRPDFNKSTLTCEHKMASSAKYTGLSRFFAVS